MVLQVETKNVPFGSIIDERMKQHHLPVSKHSSCFWAIPSFGHFKDFNISSKVFELITSALAYIKCQVIFYNTAKDEMWYSGSFGILNFYFPPLELVHRVLQKKWYIIHNIWMELCLLKNMLKMRWICLMIKNICLQGQRGSIWSV